MKKKNCKRCKKLKKITSYSGVCNSCLNSSAQEMGKLSAKARKSIHDSEYYRGMGKKSAIARKKKALN